MDLAELSGFRSFIYRSYSETHLVYSDAGKSTSTGREVNLERVLATHLPSDRSVSILDFGCGDGVLLAVAERLGYRNLTGVDLSQGLLALAASRSSAAFHHADGLLFLEAVPAGQYDVVVAFDVFEHLTRPELLDASRAIARVLKPDGILLLHVPNGASPYCGTVHWGDITHELAFTRASLQQVLAPVGFSKVEAFEDAPVAHGVRSGVRAVLWQMLRAWRALNLAVETGQLRGHVLTINMIVRATKA